MKYKGYDSEEFLTNLYAIKVVSNNGKEVISESSLQSFTNFLRSKNMDVLADLFRFALSQNNIYVFIAQKVIDVQNGKIVTNENNLPDDLKRLSEFAKISDNLPLVNLPIPVISEILAGLGIIFSLINIFSSEARTKGQEARVKMLGVADGYNAFWNNWKASGRIKSKQGEAYIKAFSSVMMKETAALQPKCVSGSVDCSKEHLQYVVRCEYAVQLTKSLVQIVSQYWNEASWKSFIDDYTSILNQLVTVPIPIKQPPVVQSEITEKTGIGSLVVPAVGVFLATKILSGS